MSSSALPGKHDVRTLVSAIGVTGLYNYSKINRTELSLWLSGTSGSPLPHSPYSPSFPSFLFILQLRQDIFLTLLQVVHRLWPFFFLQYSCLFRGLLSGKFTKETVSKPPEGSRLAVVKENPKLKSQAGPLLDDFDNDRTWALLDAMKAIGEKTGMMHLYDMLFSTSLHTLDLVLSDFHPQRWVF